MNTLYREGLYDLFGNEGLWLKEETPGLPKQREPLRRCCPFRKSDKVSVLAVGRAANSPMSVAFSDTHLMENLIAQSTPFAR